MTFDTLGLSEPLVKAVLEKGYNTPSPIQHQTIPVVLQGKDVMACAQTGTGKTAGFVLPILQQLKTIPAAKHNKANVLILAPTRELAAQIHDSILAYGKNVRISSAVVFGGVKINPQMMKLRSGVDILVATPGRLLDLYQQNAIKFDDIKILVLDEADRMLDMGFIHDIKKIIALLPKVRQNLLFSATFSGDIRQLAKGLLHQPVEINVSPQNTTAKTVRQKIYPVDKNRKAKLLSHLILHQKWQQALVFCRTKHGANKLVKLLNQDNITALAIHGNKSQAQRTKALESFKQSNVKILVATDIAARGIDIHELPQVVNFDLPNVPEDYVHRIGRTGRAGSSGQAISLVSLDEIKQLKDIERLIKFNIEREEIEGFKPVNRLPTR
ncbi:MAG: DEAD/DEAH box helicase [Proteobacteria bacterium]|nr:DEAD/DEAH box helicase [Pseudomonadota bacterium]